MDIKLNLSYYASIMLDAFSDLLCSKLCWHIIGLGQLVSRPHVQQKQRQVGSVIIDYLLCQCAKVATVCLYYSFLVI